MTVLKIDKSQGRWEAIPVKLIEDARLSLAARGLAAWLLARRDGFNVRMTKMPYLLGIGRDKCRSVFRELQSAGYISRRRWRQPNGQWIWEFTFTPVASAMDGFPVHGETGDGNADRGETGGGKSGDIQQTLNQFREENIQTTTTTAQLNRATDSWRLHFSSEIPSECHNSVLRVLDGCPIQHRQSVLDEVAGVILEKKLRSNPVALLRRLVALAAEGGFTPAAGIQIRRRRELAQAPPTERDDQSARHTAESSELARRHIAKLREQLASVGVPPNRTNRARS